MFNNHQFSHERLENATRPSTPVSENNNSNNDEGKEKLVNDDEAVKPEEKKTVPTENVVEPNKRSTILGLLSKLVKSKIKTEDKAEKNQKKRKKKTKSVKLKKAKTKFKKCYKRFIVFLNSIKALFSRLLYILHALITVWRVTVVLGDWYWVVISWLGFMVFELLIVIFKRAGREWKWIQPCILIYLMVELPSIWLLELFKVSELQIERNSTSVLLGDLIKQQEENGEGAALQINALDGLTNDWWTLLLEQSMLVLIIIARWLMPKGDMNRDQLSALLLFYLGTASDILDFFSVISEDEELVTTNYTFLFTILGFWSWSMLQFIFLVIMTKSDSDEEEEEEDSGDESNNGSDDDEETPQMKKKLISKDKPSFKDRLLKYIKIFLASEAWSILISMIFQDGPFAVVRIICLFHWKVRTYTNYFFTAKNMMILFLQIYRLLAVYEEYKVAKKEAKQKKREARRKLLQSSVKRVTFASRLLRGLGNRKTDTSANADESGAAPPLSHTAQLHNLYQNSPHNNSVQSFKDKQTDTTVALSMSGSESFGTNKQSMAEIGYSHHGNSSSTDFTNSNNHSEISSFAPSRTKHSGIPKKTKNTAVSVSATVSEKESIEKKLKSNNVGQRTMGGLSMSKSVSHGDCVIELGAYTGFNGFREGHSLISEQSERSQDLGVAELNVQGLSEVSIL